MNAGQTEKSPIESDLLLSLYRTLIEHSELSSGLRSALEIVCRFAGWDLGTAWLPSQDRNHIRLFVSWHRDDPRFAEFIRLSRTRSFPRNVGIVGRVWDRKTLEWTSDLAAQDPQFFPQAKDAISAEIRAALGVPILHEDYVVGVLLFYTREVKAEDESLVQVVSRVATQLGFALRHKLTEEELRNHEAMLQRSRDELEGRVSERTIQLKVANEALQAEIFERKRIQEEMQVRVRQQGAVAAIGECALSDPAPGALYDAVCETVAGTLDVEFCKILELQDGGEAFLLRAGLGWKEGLVGHATVETGTRSQGGYTLLCKEPVIVKDLRTEERFSAPSLLREHGVVSGLSVIIGRSDRPFGVLGAHTAKARTFSKDDVLFLQAVAHIVFQAIEHNRALDGIRRNATWLRRLIETTQDAVVSIDRRGCIVLFNAAAERVFGYSAGEIVGQKVNTLMAAPYATEHDDYIARYERTGEARAIGRIRTVEGKRKNGETFPLELSVTQVATAESEKVLYAAFIRDISEARRGQAWLQSLVETTQDAVLSIDRQGRIVLFNPAAERIFGYARGEIIGQKVNLLMAEPYGTEHDEYIARYERTHEARAIGRIRTVTARRKNGELFPIELSVTEIAVDRDVRYAAFIRDISEKTRLQQQLVESEKLAAIGGTAAKIGHEIANPLNGIYLTLQLVEQRLRRQPSADDRVANDILKIKKEIARLNQLVQEFRMLSRQQNYHFRLTEIAAVLAEVLDLQQPLCESNGIVVRRAIASSIPASRVDEDKIKQVLLNIIKNAGEAMPQGGILSVAAYSVDDTISIEIGDTGGGIPDGTDVFAPFFTTKKEGTGLGLIIARQIISAHGGAIFYDSQLGKGTTFHITLPRDPSVGLAQ